MPETQAKSAGEAERPETSARPDDILARIVETKRSEVARLTEQRAELERLSESAAPPLAFRDALSHPGEVSLIAEVKRRSPGAGPLRPELDPVRLAASYAESGAAAISVLTDRTYFDGSLKDLSAIRRAVEVPLLRKDFLISEVQLFEARAAGADAVLLIVSILDDATLEGLRVRAEALGMTALVEVHDEVELKRAVDVGATVIGINNRNLRDFTTRLETTVELLGSVPESALLVSESGIRSRDDVELLGGVGVDAVLVGEALLRAPDPARKAKELAGAGRRPRQSSGSHPKAG